MEERRSSQQEHPGVRVDKFFVLISFHHMPATKRARKGTLLRDPNEAMERFGPLKAVLGAVPAVFANREVGSKPPSQILLPQMNSRQGSAAVGDKIKVLLSHVVALEDFFDSRPGDVAEQRRRDELIQYVVVLPLNSDLSTF